MKKKTEEIVREGLLETGLIIPISSDRVWSGWDFLCRQIPGQEKPWLLCVEALLRWAEETLKKGEEFMVARKYLLKDGRMVFGWYLKLRVRTAPALLETSTSMLKVLKMVEPVAVLKPEQPSVQQFMKPKTAVGAPTLKVIQRGYDDEGKLVEITEMPLAHVKKDLNVPSKPVWSEEHGRYIGGGKGAKSTGG